MVSRKSSSRESMTWWGSETNDVEATVNLIIQSCLSHDPVMVMIRPDRLPGDAICFLHMRQVNSHHSKHARTFPRSLSPYVVLQGCRKVGASPFKFHHGPNHLIDTPMSEENVRMEQKIHSNTHDKLPSRQPQPRSLNSLLGWQLKSKAKHTLAAG